MEIDSKNESKDGSPTRRRMDDNYCLRELNTTFKNPLRGPSTSSTLPTWRADSSDGIRARNADED